jgi:hypothetical protein
VSAAQRTEKQLPLRLLAPKMGWLNRSPRRYAWRERRVRCAQRCTTAALSTAASAATFNAHQRHIERAQRIVPPADDHEAHGAKIQPRLREAALAGRQPKAAAPAHGACLSARAPRLRASAHALQTVQLNVHAVTVQ